MNAASTPSAELLECTLPTGIPVHTFQLGAAHFEIRIQASETMPFVHVTSNVPKSSVDVPAALRALSKALSAALGKPEAYLMVQLDLDTPMIFQTSDAVRLP